MRSMICSQSRGFLREDEDLFALVYFDIGKFVAFSNICAVHIQTHNTIRLIILFQIQVLRVLVNLYLAYRPQHFACIGSSPLLSFVEKVKHGTLLAFEVLSITKRTFLVVHVVLPIDQWSWYPCDSKSIEFLAVMALGKGEGNYNLYVRAS